MWMPGPYVREMRQLKSGIACRAPLSESLDRDSNHYLYPSEKDGWYASNTSGQ